MLVAGTSGAHLVAQTPGMAFSKEPAGANAAIQTVEIDSSVSVDGVTDEKEEIERRQVRILNRQGAAMLAAEKQRADAIQRNYDEAMVATYVDIHRKATW